MPEADAPIFVLLGDVNPAPTGWDPILYFMPAKLGRGPPVGAALCGGLGTR